MWEREECGRRMIMAVKEKEQKEVEKSISFYSFSLPDLFYKEEGRRGEGCYMLGERRQRRKSRRRMLWWSIIENALCLCLSYRILCIEKSLGLATPLALSHVLLVQFHHFVLRRLSFFLPTVSGVSQPRPQKPVHAIRQHMGSKTQNVFFTQSPRQGNKRRSSNSQRGLGV